MKLLIPIAAALALAACGPKSTPPPPPGPVAGLGQAAEVNGLRLRPLEVVEDSRCPARVECVWAGRVRVLVAVGAPGGGEISRHEFTLGQAASVYGGMLTLVNVDPPKGSLGSLEREAYRFTFAYSRP
jgi:hypothetical protein